MNVGTCMQSSVFNFDIYLECLFNSPRLYCLTTETLPIFCIAFSIVDMHSYLFNLKKR
jgi:hypothetical protein